MNYTPIFTGKFLSPLNSLIYNEEAEVGYTMHSSNRYLIPPIKSLILIIAVYAD